MKLIIDISEEIYQEAIKSGYSYLYDEEVANAVADGIPLDDVKTEIEQNAYPIVHGVNNHEKGMTLYGILQVLDNIGKTESEE